MKKNRNPWLVYVLALAGMIYSVWQLDIPAYAQVDGGGARTCCNTSDDCSGWLVCCDPSGGLRNCAPEPYIGYCRLSCN